MNSSLLIISSSLILQLISAAVALRLILYREKRTAGVLMLLAIFLLAFRRSLSLYRLITGGEIRIDFIAESNACMVSFLLLAGVLYISRLIASHQQEIDERTRAEGALKETNAKLQALIEVIPDIVIFKDVAGRHLLVNKAAGIITGHTTEEFPGKTVEEIFPAETAEFCRKSDEEGMRSGANVHFEEHITCKNGEKIFLDTIKGPLYDGEGNVAGLVTVSRDITERKRADELIVRLSRQNKLLLDSAGEGIYGVDVNGNTTFANPAAAKMIGWEIEELIGRQQHDILHHSKPDGAPYPREDCHIYAAFQDGEVHHVTDEVFWRKDGTSFPVEYVSTPIQDGGKIVGAVIVFNDISEQKQIEESLKAATIRAKEEKAKTEAVIASIGDMISIENTDFRIIFQNQVNKDFFGDHTGEYCYTAYHNRDSVCESCHLVETFRDGQIHKAERRSAGVNGVRYFEFTASPLKDAAGTIIGGIELIRDITERKQAEEASRLSEERLSRAQQIAHIGDWEWDIATNAVHWSDELYRIYGYEPREISPDYGLVVKTMHPDSREEFLTAIDEALKGQRPFEMDYTFSRRDGSAAILHTIGRLIYGADGKPERMLGIIQDITEQKKAQETLRDSEQRFHSLFDMATDGILLLSLDQNEAPIIVDVNNASCMMNGYTREELIGKPITFLEEPHMAREAPAMVERLMAEETVIFERNHLRKEGSLFPVEVSARMVHIGGEPYILSIDRDMTERKQVEETLRKSHVKLEVLVKERTAELRMINEQLSKFSSYLQEAREKERTAIAREIHDELGQALTALKMDLSWLKKRLPKNQKKLLEKEASMSELVEGTIQTVKKISSELRPGILDHLGLTAAIEWQAEEFQKRNGIPCSVSIVPEEIVPDRDRSTTIFRIFQETLTNIVRHAKATEVSVRLEKEEGRLALEVRDNGRGITEKQVSDPKSLGLMGIRERAAYWGGKVVVQGIRSGGTTVTVRIPLDRTGGAS
jgi:PAS domain S-box-containing protein